MKIVVTGAAGFIGMHLCENLIEKGHEITCAIDSLNPAYGTNLSHLRAMRLEESGIRITQIDIAKVSIGELVQKISSAEVVIHLAASAGVRQSALEPHRYSSSNLIGFSNVLEAVRLTKPKIFLFASSSSIYGQSAVTGPQEESSATGMNLASYYASTKWANEILAMSIAKTFKINSVALRFFTVYGSYGRPDMAYWNFAERVLNSKTISLYGFDGGRRSFSHVSDIVSIIEKLFTSKKLLSDLHLSTNHFEALNIGNESSVTTLEMLDVIGQQLNRKPKFEITERPPFDVDRTWASMNKTYSYVKKGNFLDLTEGLNEFTKWFSSHSS